MNKNYSRTSILVLMLLLVACAPSASQIQTSIAQTQAVLPTIILTNTPEPTSTSVPTSTYVPTKRPTITAPPQVEKTVDTILISIAELLENNISDVDSVTTIRPGNDSLEIELKTIWASKDRQPNISFEVIQILAIAFNVPEDKALNLVTGNPEHFSILLTTYSTDGGYKYSSLTYYDTWVKLYNKRITYDEWLNEAGAGFVN